MQPLVIQIHIHPAEQISLEIAAAPVDHATDTAAPTVPGTVYEGGHYYGRIRIDGQLYALIRARKQDGGEHAPTAWNADSGRVVGAQSYNDGLANTRAMAAAGSKVAKWALKKSINGCGDWYIPSQDELEIAYRALKPGTTKNACWGRSGMNMSAEPPAPPYTPEDPAQTPVADFRDDGPEAFQARWYWSSTQSAALSDFAWAQTFDDGNQLYGHKSYEFPVFLVRRVPIR